ncbi:MAG: amino acid-binding ACT domain-containing protein [Deltaproteobacteria bacterium]|nr:amino acid-binding ACT domain-containing protein [Deltaproteobacteria bacterium]
MEKNHPRIKFINKINKNKRKHKMKDIAVILENSPGALADLGEILGKNGINMEGLCGIPLNDEAVVHILVEDETVTRYVLESAGFKVSAVREVLVVDIGPIAGKPGSGGKMARKIGNVGVNIDLIYLAERNKIVLGVDDIKRARNALAK